MSDIERLTDEERKELELAVDVENYPIDKALRIIDALTEALGAGEPDPVTMAGYTWCKLERAETAEARVRELEAELADADCSTKYAAEQCLAAESSLAAATALLVRVQRDDSAPSNLTNEIDAFLANQPAAPCEHAGELTIDRATGEESCSDCQPAAPVYHLVGCDARDGLPCTHDCANHTYGPAAPVLNSAEVLLMGKLLRQWRDLWENEQPTWGRDLYTETHRVLRDGSQPAAPTRTDEPDVDVSDWRVPPKPTRTEAEPCISCVLDVPLSKAHTLSIWAELQLRADNPCRHTEAEQAVLDAWGKVPTPKLRALLHIDWKPEILETVRAELARRGLTHKP